MLTDRRYARAHAALWRDTGRHVVVLGPRQDAEVVVLGGGSALLWRLLDQPLELEEINRRVGLLGAGPGEVASCLDDLVDRGLVAWMIVEDEL